MKNEWNNNSHETRDKTIYMFRVNGAGEEVGEPIPINVRDDGSADLSLVPSALRETWEDVGVRTIGGLEYVKPKDGEAFLRALITSTNGYQRFRRSPDRV